MKLEADWDGRQAEARYCLMGRGQSWTVDLIVTDAIGTPKLEAEVRNLWPWTRFGGAPTSVLPPTAFAAGNEEEGTWRASVTLKAAQIPAPWGFRSRVVTLRATTPGGARQGIDVLVIPRAQAIAARIVFLVCASFLVVASSLVTQIQFEGFWAFAGTATLGIGGPALVVTLGSWLLDRANHFHVPLLGFMLRLRRAVALGLLPVLFAWGIPRQFFLRVYNDTSKACDIGSGDVRVAIEPKRWELHPSSGVLHNSSDVAHSPCLLERNTCFVADRAALDPDAGACESTAGTEPDQEPPISWLHLPTLVFECKKADQRVATEALVDGCRSGDWADAGSCVIRYLDDSCSRLAGRVLRKVRASWLVPAQLDASAGNPGNPCGLGSVTEDSVLTASLPVTALTQRPKDTEGLVDVCMDNPGDYRFEWRRSSSPSPEEGSAAGESDRAEPPGFVSAQWRMQSAAGGRVVLPALRQGTPETLGVSDGSLPVGTLRCPTVKAKGSLRVTQLRTQLEPGLTAKFSSGAFDYTSLGENPSLWTCEDPSAVATDDRHAQLELRREPDSIVTVDFDKGRWPKTLDIAVGGKPVGTLTCSGSDAGESVEVGHLAAPVLGRVQLESSKVDRDGQRAVLKSDWQPKEPKGAGPAWACLLRVATVTGSVGDAPNWHLNPQALTLSTPTPTPAIQELPCVRNPANHNKACTYDENTCSFAGKHLSPHCADTYFCTCK